ncbi:hypothetical protein BKA64DRAFT_267138 [Cadophora sp. MPI-SDFR-AT-0126]|nr:hypothetical protein BKA64DRAFT_267138 [Leotiomycetes sp. MPI-SDFR-AT-0126]
MPESTYGRACGHCFKSKSKCVIRHGGESCERCHRLKKQCSPAEHIRKRNPQNSSAARTAKLEEKLDGIVSLLQSVTGTTVPPTNIPALSSNVPALGLLNTGDSSSSSGPPANSMSTPVSSSADEYEPQLSNVTGSNGRAALNKIRLDNPHAETAFGYKPRPDEAESRLTVFRSELLPNFACIHLPFTVSANELRQSRPFLLQCIMVVTSTSVQERNLLSTELVKTLTHEVFILNKGHFDHLVGLLIFLAWGNDFGNKNHLVQLAMSLAQDLRLNRPLIDEGGHKFARLVACGVGIPTETHSLEHRRAVLGCFFISSLVSSFFGRIDPMQWNSLMDEHLRTIEESKECLNDEGFALQIRLQLLLHHSYQMRDFECEGSQHSKMPSGFYLKALCSQLHDIKASMSPRLQQEFSVMAGFHYTEVSIHERAYPADAALSCSMTGPQHLQCLCACLEAAKSFIDLTFMMPPVKWLGMPLHFRFQFMRCLVALYRLSVHEDPAWDREAVRNTIDLIAVFDHVITSMEQRSAEIGNPDDDIIIHLCRVMKGFRAFCAPKLAPDEAPLGNSNGQAIGEDDLIPEFMDFADDAWLQDVLGWPAY